MLTDHWPKLIRHHLAYHAVTSPYSYQFMLDALHLLNVSYVAHALYAATSWRVLEQLHGRDGESLEALAASCQVRETILGPVLETLQAFGYMRRSLEGMWSLGTRAKRLMDSEDGWLLDYVLIWGQQLMPAFGSIVELARSDKTGFELTFGEKQWEYNRQNPAANDVFVRFMDAATRQHTATDAIPRALALENARSVVDVGGGSGRFLAAVLQHYPHLQGVVFDQPHLFPVAEENLAAAGLSTRANFVGGNFLSDMLPAGADAYLLKHVLHDWPDQGAVVILSNIAIAMQGHSRLYLVEGLLEDNFSAKPWLRTRLLEQVVWTGGKVRTRSQFDQLLTSAGLTIKRVQDTEAAADCTILEIAKI